MKFTNSKREESFDAPIRILVHVIDIGTPRMPEFGTFGRSDSRTNAERSHGPKLLQRNQSAYR